MICGTPEPPWLQTRARVTAVLADGGYDCRGADAADTVPDRPGCVWFAGSARSSLRGSVFRSFSS